MARLVAVEPIGAGRGRRERDLRGLPDAVVDVQHVLQDVLRLLIRRVVGELVGQVGDRDVRLQVVVHHPVVDQRERHRLADGQGDGARREGELTGGERHLQCRTLRKRGRCGRE